MRLITTVNRVRVEIDLPGVTEEAYARVAEILNRALGGSGKNRDAIHQAFLYGLRACPKANASDVWHHVVYRQYCEVLARHRGADPKQSWVRAGGEALELVVQDCHFPKPFPQGFSKPFPHPWRPARPFSALRHHEHAEQVLFGLTASFEAVGPEGEGRSASERRVLESSHISLSPLRGGFHGS